MKKPGFVQRFANRVADGFLELRDPQAASQRRFWRENAGAHARQLSQFRDMASASTDRLMADWTPTGGDADAVTLDDLPIVRGRTRDAALNDPTYKAIKTVFADYVVGDGIYPKSQVDAARLGVDESVAKDWQAATDSLFREYADRADVTGVNTWPELQALMFASVFDGGDVFASYPIPAFTAGDTVRSRINLIEAERVVDPNAADHRICGGIELDSFGRRKAFHIQRGHPGAVKAGQDHYKVERWLAERTVPSGGRRLNVSQVIHQERVGQSRGVPWMAQALPLLDAASNYIDETVLQARLQNALSVWINTTGSPDVLQGSIRDDVSYEGVSEKGIRAGSINILKAGDTASFLTPTTPASFYDDFIVRMMRIVCAAAGVSFELTFDVGQANYSSIRMGMLRFRQRLGIAQSLIVPPSAAWRSHAIYEAWLDGKLPPVDYEANRALWDAATWVRPVTPWVDPAKDAAAEISLIEAGLKSRSQVIRERGLDPDAVFASIDEDAARAAAPSPDDAAPQAEPGAPDDNAAVKLKADAYATGVRAGVITPQPSDEDHFRGRLELPGMTPGVREAWVREGGVRRPVTLASPGDSPAEQPADPAEQPDNPEVK